MGTDTDGKGINDPRSYAVIGAAMEVHSVMGPGFLEAVYQEAMEIELTSRRIPYEAEPKVRLQFKGQFLKKHYRPDFLCYSDLVVEIKAQKTLMTEDQAQIINALKCTGCTTGLLINFGEPSLVFRRFVNSASGDNTGTRQSA